MNKHNHEFLGSGKIAERNEDPHNHRFVGVTGPAIIMTDRNHYHRFSTDTDFYENHFHMLAGQTGPAVEVGGGRHVHFVEGRTTLSDGHVHEALFATLIENPIGD